MNSKEENYEDIYMDFVQEIGLWAVGIVYHVNSFCPGHLKCKCGIALMRFRVANDTGGHFYNNFTVPQAATT